MTIRTWVIGVSALAAIAGMGVVIAERIADARVRARIDAVIAALPPGIGAHYASASYSLFTGQLTISGIAITNSQRGWTGVETIDKLEIAGIPRSLGDDWARISADPTVVTRDTVLPIADHLTFSGIVSKSGGTRVSLAHLAIDGVRVRPWALFQPGIPSFADIVALLAASTDRVGSDPAAQWVAAGTLARGLAAGLLALDYDDATEAGFAEVVDVPASSLATARQLMLSIAAVRLAGGLHRGVAGPSEDVDFHQSASNGSAVTVAHARFAGLDFSQPAAQLVAGAPLSRGLLDGLKIGEFSADDIAAVLPAAGAIAIAHIGVDHIGFADGLPCSAHLAVDQLRIMAAQLARNPAAANAMRMLNLDTLTISAAIGYVWDPDRQIVALDRTSLKIDELGMATLDAQIGGVAPGLSPRALADRAALTGVKLRYADRSLMNRLLAAAAARRGLDIETMRQSVMTAIPERAAMLGQSPAAAALVSALTQFVAAPTSLTLTATPPQPVPLYQLVALRQADPTTLVDLLGLTAFADAP